MVQHCSGTMIFICVGWVFIVSCLVDVSLCAEQPNILLVLTDDQDLVLGGMTPMKFTRRYLGDGGITFENAYTTSPICCPSRASLLTGRYAHNTGVHNNSRPGNCSSREWSDGPEQHTYATQLRDLNYTTFYSGKYMNEYGLHGNISVPPGWSHWAGLLGNSRYYNYQLSINGTLKEYGSTYPQDYLTNVITSYALDFIRNSVGVPFVMVLAPPAPHSPWTPAPQYEDVYGDYIAPRTPSYNNGTEGKHWLVGSSRPQLMDVYTRGKVDDAFRGRWRTLLSVDDMVRKVVVALKRKGLLENTYIFFTADNGYHLGQYALPWDKRQPYETDIHIPMLVKGPGVPSGVVRKEPVLLIDLASTFVELGGGEMEGTDGKSFVTLLKGESSNQIPSSVPWSRSFLVEYWGESHAGSGDPECPGYHSDQLYECTLDQSCKCQDSRNSTYICLRNISPEQNITYCQFKDGENFVESYDLTTDPYQLTNIPQDEYEAQLHQLEDCKGYSCHI